MFSNISAKVWNIYDGNKCKEEETKTLGSHKCGGLKFKVAFLILPKKSPIVFLLLLSPQIAFSRSCEAT